MGMAVVSSAEEMERGYGSMKGEKGRYAGMGEGTPSAMNRVDLFINSCGDSKCA